MPLREGKSRKVVSENIRTEMHSYDRKGSIGTSHPASRKKAQKQAVAIALSKSREKRANLYLQKIAERVLNMVQKDNVDAMHTASTVNEKFFTRMKLRGT